MKVTVAFVMSILTSVNRPLVTVALPKVLVTFTTDIRSIVPLLAIVYHPELSGTPSTWTAMLEYDTKILVTPVGTLGGSVICAARTPVDTGFLVPLIMVVVPEPCELLVESELDAR